jgi:hypothetical protein
MAAAEMSRDREFGFGYRGEPAEELAKVRRNASVIDPAEAPPPGWPRPASSFVAEAEAWAEPWAEGWAEPCRRPRAKAAAGMGRTGRPAVPTVLPAGALPAPEVAVLLVPGLLVPGLLVPGLLVPVLVVPVLVVPVLVVPGPLIPGLVIPGLGAPPVLAME